MSENSIVFTLIGLAWAAAVIYFGVKVIERLTQLRDSLKVLQRDIRSLRLTTAAASRRDVPASALPEELKCPKCGDEMVLDLPERVQGWCTCPVCDEIIDGKALEEQMAQN